MSQRVVRGFAERMAGYSRVLEARSTATSAARLRELAHDEVCPVRVWTTLNPNTPPDAQDTLASDDDEYVRWVALLQLRTPASALARLADDEEARHDGSFVIRKPIAHHPNAPQDLRQRLLTAGACKDCSPLCPDWRVYTDRHWHIRYEPADLFRRIEAERADQLLSWQRSDQAFFAAGACHILAWAFLERHPDSGFMIHAVRKRGAKNPRHVYVSDGLWAFDHCGWTLDQALRRAYGDAEVVPIESDLETFCAEYNHRLPEQFAYLPWERAFKYVTRYE